MQNIVFMGTPQFSAVILEALVDANFNIKGVFTQKDKPANRGLKPQMSAVKALALEKNLQIFEPDSLKDEALLKNLKALEPDFIIVAAYGKLLPKSVLELAPCINLHASLLPKYRGASCIQAAILNGDSQSGVTAMLMNEGLDTGDILKSVQISIKDKRADEVFNEFAKLAAKLCVETLKEFSTLKPIKQDESRANYCKKIKKEDGLIDFSTQNAREIYQKFLAFYPWPGIFLKNGLKFKDIKLVENLNENLNNEILNAAGFEDLNQTNSNLSSNLNLNLNPAQIVSVDKEGFIIACKSGLLRIKALQEAGKKAVGAVDYLNGKRLKCGAYLS